MLSGTFVGALPASPEFRPYLGKPGWYARFRINTPRFDGLLRSFIVEAEGELADRIRALDPRKGDEIEVIAHDITTDRWDVILSARQVNLLNKAADSSIQDATGPAAD